MIDVNRADQRRQPQSAARMLEAGEARVMTISQTYDATARGLWDACTNAERIPRWFMPITGDLRLGGRYQLEGNAGGTIERCDPPKGFAATWEFGGEVSWIEVRLTPIGGRPDPVRAGARRARRRRALGQFGPGAVGVGWDLGLLGLALHLVAGARVDAGGGRGLVGVRARAASS